jgi:predicted phosphodiesterase
MRVAAFSDTHGNLLALEAVLADIERHGPFDHLLMAGDVVAGGPRPAETLARIQALRCPVVLGNTDFYLFADDDALGDAGLKASERRMNAWAAERIGPAGVEYLKALPRSFQLAGPDGGIRMVHANPHDLEAHIAPEEDDATLARRLASVREPVLLFGHLHIAYQRRLGGLLLVDVASAGFPRDGDQRAAWAEVRHEGSSWEATIHRVAYDLDAVVRDMLASGMPRAEKRARVLREARY